MHYYIHGNRTGDGKCFASFVDTQGELLRMIAKKLENADTYQAKVVGRCMGEVANWTGWCHDESDFIEVGSDTWRILECQNSTCKDDNTGDW